MAGRAFPCTKIDGKGTGRRRRRRGNLPAAWKGGREARRGDRRRVAELRRPSQGGGAMRAGKGGEVARGEEETSLLLLLDDRGEGEAAWRRWRSSGAPLMAAKVGKLGGTVTGRGKVRRRSSGCWRRLHGVVVEAEGRGAVGNDGEGRRPAHGEEKGRSWRLKEALTGGPHLSAGGRERRQGRWWSGPREPEVGSWAAAERKRGGRGKWAASRLGREREEGVVCFFSFFPNPF
jgi:hypothetical protein